MLAFIFALFLEFFQKPYFKGIMRREGLVDRTAMLEPDNSDSEVFSEGGIENGEEIISERAEVVNKFT